MLPFRFGGVSWSSLSHRTSALNVTKLVSFSRLLLFFSSVCSGLNAFYVVPIQYNKEVAYLYTKRNLITLFIMGVKRDDEQVFLYERLLS